jgi:starch-binding outer membrane protein, SusD/RagB family
MKFNRIILIIFIAIATAFAGCKKFLERPPEGQLTKDEALKDEQSLLDFMNGIYGYIGDLDFMGGRLQILNDLLGDELRGDRFTGDFAEIYKRQNSIFGGTRDAFFLKGYKIIDRSNVALENLSLASSQKNFIEGQAKFFRGMAHFEVVRLFAQPWGYASDNNHLGIPLRVVSNSQPMDRATVKEVYDQVIADLKSADTLLSADPASGKYYTATKWVAKAYLAKVYFQMNDFANAYKYADEVIKSGKFQLDDTYNNRFSQGLSKEGILVIKDQTTAYAPGGDLRSNFRSDKSIPTLSYTDAFFNIANAKSSDKRKAWYSNTLQPGYNVLSKYNMDYFDLPVVHLTEIKLIRAEAGAEIASSSPAALITAIADINDILTRAYGGSTHNLPSTATANGVINTVRAERELELVGEGNRIQEIKRLGARNGVSVDRRGSPWNCNGLILQFPKSEQDAYAPFQMNPEGGCF